MIQSIQESSTKLGIAATTVGSGGLTIQIFTEWMGLGLMTLNLVLAIGGLYLMCHKIKIMRAKAVKQTRRKDDE